MKPLFTHGAAAALLCAAAAAGDAPPPSPLLSTEPLALWDQWSLDFDTAVLWRISDNTTASYVLAPQKLSLKTPQHALIEIGDSLLLLRARFSLLGEWVARGPENYYLGFSAAPSIEWWLPGRQTVFELGAGGGLGWVDSHPEMEGAQGQDRTFNWFVQGGVRHYLSDGFSIAGGVFFQHMSNRGATDPNPGLDALGPFLGLSWSF